MEISTTHAHLDRGRAGRRRGHPRARLVVASLVGTALLTGMTAGVAHAAPVTKKSASSKTVRPRVTVQPKAITAASGKKAKFTVKAKGKHLTYRWYVKKAAAKTWKKATGPTAKKRTYTVRAAAGLDAASYRVVVTNAGGSVTSRARTLTVVSKPTITSAPTSVIVSAGTKAEFTVSAKGNKLRYQWQTQASPSAAWTTLPGKTGAKLTLTARAAGWGSKYRAVVSNTQGRVTSAEAWMFVRSTRDDPYALGKPVLLNDWFTGFVLNDHVDLSDGTYGVISQITTCYYGDEGSALPWLDLDVAYVGTDGASYDNDGIYVDGDIWDTDLVYEGGCTSFFGVAIVPSSVVFGGVWSVRDSSDWSNTVEGFFQGL